MNKTYVRLTILFLVFGLIISACSPQIESTSELSTVTADAPIAYSTPTFLPTMTTVSEDFLPEEIPTGIKLNFWHPWSGEIANLIDEMVGEFNKSNEWGITVNAEFHSDEIVFIDDMNQAIQEGYPPELIAAPGYYLRFLAESGFALQDLQKFVGSQYWGFSKEETESFLPIFWNSDISSSKRLGVPAYQSGYFIFYNQTWARELGFLQPPLNPDDFRNQTCEANSTFLKDDDFNNDGKGGWLYTFEPNAFYSWLKAFGGGNEAEANNSNILGRIENVESGSYLYDLFLENCSWKDLNLKQQPNENFANRLALAYSGKMEDIIAQERVNKMGDQWSVIPYPSKTDKPVLLVDGDSYAISTNDEDEALAAWVFIRWMLNPENQVRVVEESGTFPLSETAMDLLNGYKIMHPAWAASLKYLPLAQKVPDDSSWGLTKEVLADVSWKLIQYTTKRDDIPVIFQDAQNLLSEIIR